MFGRVPGLVALAALTGCATTASSAPAPSFAAVAAERPALEGSFAALSFAQAQVGKHYCWGGAGPGCFDCSGLVQAAWRAGGVALPRTTAAQGKALPSVDARDARPGDVFWWRHGHVALYAGNGLLIDAYHSRAGVVLRRAPVPDRILRVAPATRAMRR